MFRRLLFRSDAVLAQRLCRSLCERCKEPYVPEPTDLTRVGFPWAEGEPLPTLPRPAGCSACAQTGYRGRLALHAVMTMSEDIERLAVARASPDAIARPSSRHDQATLGPNR